MISRMKLSKKVVAMLLVSISVVLALCGCAITTKGKLKEATNEVMDRLINWESENVVDTKNLNGSQGEVEKMTKYLGECAGKIKYEIKDVDTDNLAVTISCTYVDSSAIWTSALQRMISQALVVSLSNGSENDVDIDTIFAEEAAKVTEPTFVTKDVVLYFEKGDDGYVLKEDNPGIKQVALSNIGANMQEMN